MDQLQAFYRVNHEHLISFNFHAWTVTAASPSISNDILKFLMKIYDNKNKHISFFQAEGADDSGGWKWLVTPSVIPVWDIPSSKCSKAQIPFFVSSWADRRRHIRFQTCSETFQF